MALEEFERPMTDRQRIEALEITIERLVATIAKMDKRLKNLEDQHI